MSKIKQVIVIRKDLNMRKGKMVAQGAHASMAFIAKEILQHIGTDKKPSLTSEQIQWMNGMFAKICVSVDSEEELLQIFSKAEEQNLTVELITDGGLTEFHGQATHTCLAIGPHQSEKIDPITSHLKLL